ncbi:MAG TPA: alginate lyase family protein [Pyrinomonadaceae bacterium]|nr:alginate lyase family protein [Pyrinomonadaceae bacterium]
MHGAIKKLKKLRGVGLEELRVRGAQSLSVRAERLRLSSQTRVPSDAKFFKLLDARRMNLSTLTPEILLEHFRTRPASRFFRAFGDETATRAALRTRFGSEAAEVSARAARIREGRFRLLGLDDLDLGNPPDWHLEPVTGKRAPRERHWSRIEYLNAEVAGDKKFIWELNRHQYFMTLGRAYRLTGDELLAETFAAHLSNWMDENPPKLGINWASSLEVSLRAISWLWAFEFFKHSRAVSPALYARALKFLYLHARHLETYLSTYFSPNTHLTGEALGLYYLGTLLPELRRAPRWRALGREILLAQLERHALADGVYFERSTYYQRYTTDFYTHFLLLSRANGEPLEAPFEEKLCALYEHLMWITRPDGTTPYFGDDDGGRLLPFDSRDANDFRATLANGALLFKRADYKFVAGAATEELLWLFGAEGLREFDGLEAAPPAAEARAFPSGGFYVMRDGWLPDSNYLMLDCGAHGTANCGHAHADALSFDLAARGRTLVTDPGTYTYTGSHEWRDYFRSTRAHNTLAIDNESSSVPAGAFSWQHVAGASAGDWHEHARFTAFNGSTDGYMRLASPAEHRRSILLLKGDYFIIRDQVETAGAHTYELNFHFAPDAAPEVETDDGASAVRERAGGEAGLELFTFGARGKWRTTEGWVSTCYGARTPAPVVSYAASGEGAQEFFSFLIPRRAGQGRASVREIETKQGRAFEVVDEDVRDLLIVGAQASDELRGIRSDFAGAWVRFSARGEAQATEFVLISGSRFEIEGQLRVAAPDVCSYIVGRLTGRGWELESDADGSEIVFEETANPAPGN